MKESNNPPASHRNIACRRIISKLCMTGCKSGSMTRPVSLKNSFTREPKRRDHNLTDMDRPVTVVNTAVPSSAIATSG